MPPDISISRPSFHRIPTLIRLLLDLQLLLIKLVDQRSDVDRAFLDVFEDIRRNVFQLLLRNHLILRIHAHINSAGATEEVFTSTRTHSLIHGAVLQAFPVDVLVGDVGAELAGL